MMNYRISDFKCPLQRSSHYRVNRERGNDVTQATNKVVDSHNCRSEIESESNRDRKWDNIKRITVMSQSVMVSQINGISTLFNGMFWQAGKKTSKLRIAAPMWGESHDDGSKGQQCEETWWRHQMETFFPLLALCAGNSPVSDEFPSQRLVLRSFDVSLICALNTRLSKQSGGWWFETPSRLLWRHCNEHVTWKPVQMLLSFYPVM